MAALISRSCRAEQALHVHSLTPSVPSPLGPVLSRQTEQVTLENDSQTDTQNPASLLALYSN